jgi:hypothetical protein
LFLNILAIDFVPCTIDTFLLAMVSFGAKISSVGFLSLITKVSLVAKVLFETKLFFRALVFLVNQVFLEFNDIFRVKILMHKIIIQD